MPMYMVTDTGEKMQNVYTPLSLTVHIIFCVIATALYLTLYYRRGSVHYLLLMFAIDATIITQYWTTTLSITLLGISEIVLVGTAIFFYVKYSRKLKAENAAKEAAAKEAEERARAAEKAESDKDQKLVDNAFDDDF
ncbi:MAG: hypothetical protein IKO27_05555 [Ruminococcus sp.]|nr:hypothetical protein [Ruminococcus sp.]